MSQKTDLLVPVLKGQPVIPVLLIDKVEHAVPLARALAKGGLPAIEITLRTAAALDAMPAAICTACPGRYLPAVWGNTSIRKIVSSVNAPKHRIVPLIVRRRTI